MKYILAIFFVGINLSIYGQSVGIGTQTPDPSAALEISSTDQGVLIPRTDTSAITNPVQSLLIFQNSDQRFYYYDGGQWLKLGGAGILADTDADTRVDVETTPDDDVIRFISEGVEVMSHDGKMLEMKNNGESVFVGESAGRLDDLSDNKNVFVGYKAGENNTTGTHNSAIGNQALGLNTSGNNNVAIGQQSLFKSNGSNNVGIGLNAAKENTTGSKSIAIGNYSNFNNQTGTDNVSIGDEAGRGAGSASTSGNIFLGSRAGKSAETDGNVAIGRDALQNNSSGGSNIAIGDSAMQAGTATNFLDFGSDNIAIGANAAKTMGNGRKNTIIGNDAAMAATSGSFNSILGYGSGQTFTSGSHNTLVGFKTGEEMTTGASNVLLGSEAGNNSTTGGSNVFIGRRAGFVNSEGNNNIAIGESAGQENRTGNNNLYLGHHAGQNVNGESGNVYIGHEAGKDMTGSNQLIIANEGSTPLIEGRFDSLSTQINGSLSINNPDSTGYTLPESDGAFGSVLRSDGTGEAYWFSSSTTNSGGGTSGVLPLEDDSSDESDNFEAAPCQVFNYYYDFTGIDGEATSSNYLNTIEGYGIDFSANTSNGGLDCSNTRFSIRKALDKATPKLFQKLLTGALFTELVIYQTIEINGQEKEIMEYTLGDVLIKRIRHETYDRQNGKYSTYEVIDISYAEIMFTYRTYDASGVLISEEDTSYDCGSPF